MAGELKIRLRQTGLTVKGLVFNNDKTERWTGSSFTSISSVADTNWDIGMTGLTEQLTSDTTPTKIYTADFPTGITTPGEYEVEYHTGVSPAVDAHPIGIQGVDWDGISSTPRVSNRNLYNTIFSSGISGVEDNSAEHSLTTLILQALESESSGTTLTINKVDGSTYLTKVLQTGDVAGIIGIS